MQVHLKILELMRLKFTGSDFKRIIQNKAIAQEVGHFTAVRVLGP